MVQHQCREAVLPASTPWVYMTGAFLDAETLQRRSQPKLLPFKPITFPKQGLKESKIHLYGIKIIFEQKPF